MKKISKKQRTLNDIIASLNKPAYVLLITSYVLLLFILLIIISPRKEYLIIPDYDHDTIPQDIDVRIELIFENDDNGDLTKISVRPRLSTRDLDNEGSRERLLVERFQMSAHTNEDRMHYFTEQSARTVTSITHNYTMTTIPQSIFTKVNYEDINDEKQVITIREDIMLDLRNKNNFTRNNKIFDAENEETEIEVRFTANKTNDNYNIRARIYPSDVAFDKNYHIDMQSWIVTEDEEAYPFIGVYGFADVLTRYDSYIDRPFPTSLNPKELYCKLNYYVDGEQIGSISYREYLDQLPENFLIDSPSDDNVIGENPKGLTGREITLIVIGSLLLVISLSGVYYYVYKHRKEEKEELNKK